MLETGKVTIKISSSCDTKSEKLIMKDTHPCWNFKVHQQEACYLMKSSKPWSLIVSGSYPLSVRHQGQFRDMPSFPQYKVSTQYTQFTSDNRFTAVCKGESQMANACSILLHLH